MNKYFRCNGLTKEQAIQAARDWADREGVGFNIERSMELHYLESDIVIIGSINIGHAGGDLDVTDMQEVPALKPLTIVEADRAIKAVECNFKLIGDSYWGYSFDSNGELLTINKLEQILQIMRRIEK